MRLFVTESCGALNSDGVCSMRMGEGKSRVSWSRVSCDRIFQAYGAKKFECVEMRSNQLEEEGGTSAAFQNVLY